jgi:hypothetical protein
MTPSVPIRWTKTDRFCANYQLVSMLLRVRITIQNLKQLITKPTIELNKNLSIVKI